MIEERIEQIFNKLYGEIDGYRISTKSRLETKKETENLLYGEISLESCQKILERANPKKGKFYDLGSGTGRVVIAMQLLGNFEKSIGVELLEGLHEKATELHTVFAQNGFSDEAKNIQFFNDDLFNINLEDADFVILNHPFKEGEAFPRLENKFVQELRPGTKIVSTIRALENKKFKRLGNANYEFSWGNSTAYFFEVI